MLETIWFILWGVLWAVYCMLDGFDLGAGMLLPALANDETERRAVHRAIGPFWNGNEVWLITAGGVTFAAFPGAYAVLFSAFYTALMLLLFALILRGVSIEFRGKLESPAWRSLWDRVLVASSFVPALLLGVTFANLFQGVPIDSRGVFQGNLLTLLSPYALAGGALFVLLFLQHGALWLAIKTQGELRARAIRAARVLWLPVVATLLLFLGGTAVSTPLFSSYLARPYLSVLPGLAVAGLWLTRHWSAKEDLWKAWAASATTIVGCVGFGVGGLYPNMIPSSLDAAHGITAFNAASSPLTLQIMLAVTLVMVPVVIAYQAWAYHTFRHAIDPAELAHEPY